MSQANVEIFQCFPDGVPREVIITGSAEEVELAEAMVNEVSQSACARQQVQGLTQETYAAVMHMPLYVHPSICVACTFFFHHAIYLFFSTQTPLLCTAVSYFCPSICSSPGILSPKPPTFRVLIRNTQRTVRAPLTFYRLP